MLAPQDEGGWWQAAIVEGLLAQTLLEKRAAMLLLRARVPERAGATVLILRCERSEP